MRRATPGMLIWKPTAMELIPRCYVTPSFLDKSLPAKLAPLIILLLGLSLTFLAWNASTQAARKIQQEKFEFRVKQIVAGISQRLKSYEQVLLGASGLFAASVSVEREEFRDYLAKLRLGDNFPGIQGVGFSLRIPAAEKQHHLEKIRSEGFPDYTLRPEGQRDPYSAIIYLEPFDWRNQRAFGFDMYSEPVRRAAMDAAWKEGVSAISGKVKLVQETSRDVQWGFLMYVPVYRNGTATDSVATRRANLLGWAYAPFRMNDFMQGILGKEYGEAQPSLRLEIFDGAAPSDGTRMFDSNPQNRGISAESFHASRQIEFGMHSWTVAVHSLPGFEMQETRSRLMIIGYSGIAISLLMAFAAWLLFSRRARALMLAEKMAVKFQESESRNSAIMDNVLDGVITINSQGAIQSFNKAAERIFGYPPPEVIGQNVKMLMPEPYHGEHDGYLHNYISTGNRKIIGIGREVVGRRKDGTTFPMDLAVTEMRLGEQRVFAGIIRDITERKKSLFEVARFKNILDNTLDMIFMFDPHTLCFVYLNKGTVESLGYTREELIGRPVWEIKPRMPEAVFRSFIAPLLQDEKPWLNYETVYLSKDGTELPVEVFLQLVEEGDGQRLFVAIARDLTERRKIDKLKSEFISTVSHELRTPLTSIRGSLGLLRGGVAGELPQQVKPMIEIAYSNAERLVRLINDILDMEKIESGKMHFEFKALELMPLINQALAANHGYGEQHQVRFALGAALPGVRVNVDTDRLSQVLANLLSNAAKFSPPGEEVTVSVKECGPLLRVEVSDHGPGIPEEFRARIFQKFSQADSSDTKQKGGTGLGLSITKAIVEKMGGNIGFVSEAGRGTTFFFELPRAVPAGDAPDEASALRGLSRLADRHPAILHVEDDPDIRQVLKALIGGKGEVVSANSLAMARNLLESRHFDLIVLDIGLPDGSGLDILPYLAERELSMPVMLFSATEVGPDMAQQVGAALVKSRTSNQQLLETIMGLIEKRG